MKYLLLGNFSQPFFPFQGSFTKDFEDNSTIHLFFTHQEPMTFDDLLIQSITDDLC